jgi:hypothetical protein
MRSPTKTVVAVFLLAADIAAGKSATAAAEAACSPEDVQFEIKTHKTEHHLGDSRLVLRCGQMRAE